jgi:hypothetical protein
VKSSDKIDGSLWEQRDKEPLDKKGPLYGEVVNLRNTLDIAKKYGILHKRKDDGSFYADSVRDQSLTNSAFQITAEAAIRPKDDSVYLALNDESTNSTTYYQIGHQGAPVELGPLRPIDKESDEMKELSHFLNKSAEKLESPIKRKEKQIRKKRKKIGYGALSFVGAGALAAGGYWGFQTWHVQPLAAANAHRVEYNAQGHTLPGGGMSIEAIPFESIPSDQFNAIPSYGGIDHDLQNPRTIKLDSKTGCADLSTSIPEGADLRVALPAGSSFMVDHYYAYPKPKSDGFTVCVAEGMPSDNRNGDLQVAVQIK